MTAKTIIPTSAVELEEMLHDSAQMRDLFGKPKEFGEFIRNYAAANSKADPAIGAQVQEETQRILAEWLKENGVKNKLNLSPGGQGGGPDVVRNKFYNNRAPGAKIDEAELFNSSREFFAAAWHRARTPEALAARDKMQEIRNGFGSVVPSDGGFLIPETLRSELLRVSMESAIVRPRARVIPMETLRVPFPTVDASSHANNVYGGVTAYWTEEAAALTESSATFGRVVLEALKLTAYSEVPNELFSDSIASLDAFINQIFPEAMAWFEDLAFISGSGVGEPLGFMNAGAMVNVTKETGQPAGTIVWENILKAYSRMLPQSLGKAVWIAHIDTFPELATMALNVGTGGSAVWLNNGVGAAPMSILGRPVIFTEKANSVGTVGDISFVDLGYYLIGDRQSMSAEMSPHYKFQNDKTAIRFIQRLDGRPWLETAITPQTGTNTLSPFVQIATRA